MSIGSCRMLTVACILLPSLLTAVPEAATAAERPATVTIRPEQAEMLERWARQVDRQAQVARSEALAVRKLAAEVVAGRLSHQAFVEALKPHLDRLEGIASDPSDAAEAGDGEPSIARFDFFEAWPSKWKGWDLDGKGTDNVAEEVELAVKEIERAGGEEDVGALAGKVMSGEMTLAELLRRLPAITQDDRRGDTFARSDFKDMEDAEKLSSPAFEQMESGVTLEPGSPAMTDCAIRFRDAMSRYQAAGTRMQRAMRQLRQLLQSGRITQAQFMDAVRAITETMQQDQQRLVPAMQMAGEHIQRLALASIGGRTEEACPSPEQCARWYSELVRAAANLDRVAQAMEMVLAQMEAAR